jgi:hypothetical protein
MNSSLSMTPNMLITAKNDKINNQVPDQSIIEKAKQPYKQHFISINPNKLTIFEVK